MCRPGRTFAAAFAAIAGLIGTTPAADAADSACDVRYELIPLGSLAPGGFSSANAINNGGQVTGLSTLEAPGASTAHLWSCATGMENIGASSNLPDTYGVTLNERSEVIVYSSAQWPSLSPTPLIWDRKRGARPLGTGDSFFPHTITNFGLVTDSFQTWTERRGLQPLNVGAPIFDSRMTHLGRVSGIAHDPAGHPHFFTWTARDGLQDLGTAPVEYALTEDINDRGDLLVHAYGDLGTTLIVDTQGRVITLPKPIDVFTVNGRSISLSREVVGVTLATAPQSPTTILERTFLWTEKHGYRNLDQLIFGSVTTAARFIPTNINDWGWVSGNFNTTGAIAVPVPARDERFRNLGERTGAPLCRALNLAKLHRLVCSIADR